MKLVPGWNSSWNMVRQRIGLRHGEAKMSMYELSITIKYPLIQQTMYSAEERIAKRLVHTKRHHIAGAKPLSKQHRKAEGGRKHVAEAVYPTGCLVVG